MTNVNSDDIYKEYKRKRYDVPMYNKQLWENYPERATEAALDAIKKGGFTDDHINRRVGDYEHQLLAIQRDWAVLKKDSCCVYVITEAGIEALKQAGKPVPNLLPALDTWHNTPFHYCVYEEKFPTGEPYLYLFDKVVPSAGNVGMEPRLRLKDVEALRDYLNGWLERNQFKNTVV